MCAPPLIPGHLPRKVADLRQQNIAKNQHFPNVSNVANMEPEAEIDFIALRYLVPMRATLKTLELS